MIKANKSTVEVRGDLTDVIFECHHLIMALIQEDPEIIVAVMYKNADGLQEAIKKCDFKMTKTVEDYIDHIELMRKVSENEH